MLDGGRALGAFVLIAVTASGASAAAASVTPDFGPGIIVETREAFPSLPAPLVDGPKTLQSAACPTGEITGDTANELDRTAPKIRAIEVVPSDLESDPQVRDAIAAAVADMTAHVANQPGSRRTLRFDVGTRCGPDSVDVHSIKLPRTQAQYQASCDTKLFEEVAAALPRAAGPRNSILFARTFDCGLIGGYADNPKDDQPGPANEANRGGYSAVTFDVGSRTALHEIGHNLGAVQVSAPHSDQGAHCYDNDDTMCYAYTAAVPTQTPLLRPCAVARDEPQPFDCGQDDYFSPAPAAGSYLATHWNVYDSVFMCEIASCVPRPATAPADPSPAAASSQGAVAGDPAVAPAEARLGLAVRATRRGRRRVLLIEVTGTGRVRVEVRYGRATLLEQTRGVRKGRLVLRVPVARSGRYTVTATSVGRAGDPRASRTIRVR